MRLGIISDMHGNAVALQAALKDLEQASPDSIVCLGDAIQGGPQPAEIVSILQERNIPTVRRALRLGACFSAAANS